jgi:hypothetical protein
MSERAYVRVRASIAARAGKTPSFAHKSPPALDDWLRIQAKPTGHRQKHVIHAPSVIVIPRPRGWFARWIRTCSRGVPMCLMHGRSGDCGALRVAMSATKNTRCRFRYLGRSISRRAPRRTFRYYLVVTPTLGITFAQSAIAEQSDSSTVSPALIKSITDLLKAAGHVEDISFLSSGRLHSVAEIFGAIAWPAVLWPATAAPACRFACCSISASHAWKSNAWSRAHKIARNHLRVPRASSVICVSILSCRTAPHYWQARPMP